MNFDDSLARLIGCLIGDGCVGKYRMRSIPRKDHYEHGITKVGNYYRIEFYSKTPELLKNFSEIFFEVFKKRIAFDKKKDRVFFSSDKESFKTLTSFANFGCSKWRLKSIEFDKSSILALFGGLVDTDGYVEINKKYRTKRLILTSVNKNGLKQIQNLLLKFLDVSSKIFGPYENAYRLVIRGKNNFMKLKDLKLVHPLKITRLKEIIND